MPSSTMIESKKTYTHASPVAGVADKKCPADFTIPRAGDFDTLFASYFKAREAGFADVFNKKRFTVRDTRASYRVMTSWSKHRVLPEGVRRGGNWKKFSTVELLWVDTIYVMQEFGLSLKAIAAARNWVMQWDKQSKSYPWFEYYVASALMSDADAYILVSPNGVAELAISDEIEAAKAANPFLPHTLHISLKTLLLKGFDFRVPKPSVLHRATEDERHVLKQIRDEENREVKVSTRAGKIKEVEWEQVYPDSRKAKIADIKKDLENTSAYGELTLRVSNGKPQSITVRKKRRLEAISQ